MSQDYQTLSLSQQNNIEFDDILSFVVYGANNGD